MSTHRIPGVFMALLLLVSGCSDTDGVEKPDNLVEADKMARILTQVHLAEAQVGRYALRSTDSSTLIFKRLQTGILKKYGVDTSAYRKSYIYYSAHPDKLEAIYANVTKELQKMSNVSSTSTTAPSTATATRATVGSGTLQRPQ